MRWARIILIAIVVVLVAAFLHYTLPQRDVARITDTEIVLQDFNSWNRMFYAQSDAGNPEVSSRDVRFINTVLASGNVMVYRNEDTGFGWPPYFKFDSADLHAEAANLISTAAVPQWVVITHYGWRLNLPTTYANAVSIRPVDGPDQTLIPWLNIVILLVIFLIGFMAWRVWERFEDRVIDPIIDRIAVRWAKVKDWAAGRRAP